MSTMLMNSNKSKTSDAYRLSIDLADKIDIRRGDKQVALSEHSIYYTLKDIKKLYKNNKLKISGTA